MRYAGSCGAVIALALACGPAVPADSSATSDAPDLLSDDGLPPLTSGPADSPQTSAWPGDTAAPDPIYDVGATSGIPPLDPCQDSWTVGPLTPRVVFVVDLSGSMATQTLDHDADPRTLPVTRWFALRTALEADLFDWDASHHLGLRSFPSATAPPPPDAAACDLDEFAVVPGFANADTILEALPPADETALAGATPLRAALLQARDLLWVGPGEPNKYIVVLTDGAPNCTPGSAPPASFDELDFDTQRLMIELSNEGIDATIVAFDVPDADLPAENGEPAGNPRDALSILGQFGQFRIADDMLGLQVALSATRQEMISNRVRVPPEIEDYQRYDVEIDGTTYFAVNTCSDDGYLRIYGPSGDALQMCGSAQTALMRAGVVTIRPWCFREN